MTIEVLGASFDPPHLGHQQIIEAVLAHQLADQVWLVPAKQHAFSKNLTEPRHRLAMLELLLENFSGKPAQINQYELEKEGVSYSYETLDHFALAYPEYSFAWVIGSDNLANFHKWHRYLDLLKRFPVHVYPRPNFPLSPLYEGMQPLKGMKEVGISSTDVRETAKLNKDLTPLVGEKVARYIKDNHLYR